MVETTSPRGGGGGGGGGGEQGGGGGREGPPPLFRWAGSKRQIVETLAKAWPGEDHRYVEPFAGSACHFFHLRPASALLADINTELVTTYCVLADDPDGVYAKLTKIGPASREVYPGSTE